MFTYFLWHWLSIVEWRWLQCLSLWVLVTKGTWIIRGSGWFWLALFEFHCSWVYFCELSLELIDREDIRNPTAWLIRAVQEALDKLLACSYLLMRVILHDSIAYLRVSSLKSDLMCSYLIKQNGTTRHVKCETQCISIAKIIRFFVFLTQAWSWSEGWTKKAVGCQGHRKRRWIRIAWSRTGIAWRRFRSSTTGIAWLWWTWTSGRISAPRIPADPIQGSQTLRMDPVQRLLVLVGPTPLAETADLLGLGGNGSGSPEESHDDVMSNNEPAVWTHGMFPHISTSHPEAWLLNSNNWIVHIVESWNRNMFKPNWFV